MPFNEYKPVAPASQLFQQNGFTRSRFGLVLPASQLTSFPRQSHILVEKTLSAHPKLAILTAQCVVNLSASLIFALWN